MANDNYDNAKTDKAARDAFNKRRARAKAKRVAKSPCCELCKQFVKEEFPPLGLALAPGEFPGTCHRYPPLSTHKPFVSTFLGVLSTQCCGEFRRKT